MNLSGDALEFRNKNGMPLQLRVCHVISSFRPAIGGAERATEILCTRLRRDGVDAIVLTRRLSSDLASYENVSGIPVYRLGYPNRGKVGALTYALHSLWMLATRLRTFQIIHAQSPDAPLLIGFLAKILFNRKLVVTIHGEKRIFEKRRTFQGRVRLNLMKKFVDCFTAISPEVEQQLLAINIPASHIQSIPNGVDTAVFRPPDSAQRIASRTSLRIRENDQVVLYLGRLVDWKQVDLLLISWKSIFSNNNECLLIVGSGPEYQALKEFADKENVVARFEGPTDNTMLYLQSADVFVLPSGSKKTGRFEGLSVALMEAMSTGLAVIASECPGNEALIRNRQNGLLFKPEDADDLTDKLNLLLNEPDLRQRLGKNAREYICQRLDIEVAGQRTKLIYESVINNK